MSGVRVSSPFLLAVLVLPGCFLTVDEVNGKIAQDSGVVEVDDTAVELEPLEVRAVEPPWSPGAGGLELTIDAGPLGANPQVTIGGFAADVISSSEQEVIVSTPAGLTGLVDVTVRSGTRSETLEQALRYYPDESGKTALYGSFSWIHWPGLDRDYTEPADSGFVWIRPIEPSRIAYTDVVVGAPNNDCVSGHEPMQGASRLIDTNTLSLSRSGGSPVSLAWSTDTLRYEGTLNNGQFLAGTTYDLEPISTDAWPDVGVPGLVRVPDAFSVSEPDLEWRAFPSSFGMNSTIRWSGGVPGDHMVIIIERFEGLFGESVAEVVTCLATDDGEFQVPGDVWDAWSVGNSLRFWIGRVTRTEAVAPHTGATTDVVGASWVLGSGLQSN